MNRIALFCVSIYLFTNLIYSQDIIGKLGGNTASETYDITDSGDNLLFRVQGDGTVGIGTASPGPTKLHTVISSTSTYAPNIWYNDILRLTNDQNGDNYYARMVLETGGWGKAIFTAVRNTDAVNPEADLAIQLVEDGSTFERVRIKADGNVGIGTATPSEKLDVVGNIAVSGTVDGIDIATAVSANTAKVTDDDKGVTEVYGAGWDSDTDSPTKNDIYDKIQSLSSGADNLGNHTATQDLNMASFEVNLNGGYLSGDGDNEGVFVDSDGDVGIGTASPVARLHINGNDGLLVKGTWESGVTQNLGAGTRLHFYPKLGAFRVGRVNGINWDDTSMGNFSIATGYNSKASGYSSTAIGRETVASGNTSTAMGYYTRAEGNYSTALGSSTTASGYYSIATGIDTEAESYASMAVGRYNKGGGTASSWVTTEPIFEIGIGTSMLSKANAMTVLKNGNVGIGAATPAEKLDVIGNIKASGSLTASGGNSNNWNTAYGWGNHASAGYLSGSGLTSNRITKWNGSQIVNSTISDDGSDVVISAKLTVGQYELGPGLDIHDVNGKIGIVLSSERYKYDIQPMKVNTDDILKLSPVTFKYKENNTEDYGFIAEDVAEQVSDLVIYNDNEQPESVRYSKLAIFLVEVVKKQQKTIEDLTIRIEKLEYR